MCSNILRTFFVLVLLAAPWPGLSISESEAAVSELRLRRLHFFYRFQQGRSYWNSGSYLEAAAHFQSLMTQYDELPRPLQLQLDYYLGAALHEVQLFTSAEGRLQSVLAKTFLPTFVVDAAVRLMDIYALNGDLALVERTYDNVANRALTPDLKIALDYGAVKAYFRLGEFRRVRDVTLTIDPDTAESPRALLLSAIAMSQLGEYGAAEDDLRRILKGQARLGEYGLGHIVPRIYFLLAQVQFDGGNYGASLQSLQQVNDEAFVRDVLFARAWNFLMLGQYQRGMETFRDFALKYPEDARSLEATILGGYILLNLAQFPESYAYFDTLETQYRQVVHNVTRFRRGVRSSEALELFLRDPIRLASSPIPSQIADWVLESRRVAIAEAAEAEVVQLGRKLDDFGREMKRMRVVSAGFGSTFDNPATLERLLRNEMGLRLTEIRSRILELMLKPIREGLLAQQAGDYSLINQAQSTRASALEIIRVTAAPTKERAVAIQRSLRSVGHYLHMVASEELIGQPDPARKNVEEKIQLSRPAVEVIDRLMNEEERVAFMLLAIMEEEERLWSVVANTIEIERGAAERILRKLGLWDTQAYIDRLELLYRSTSGVESILNDNGRLLLEIQRNILDDVIAYTDGIAGELNGLRNAQAGLSAAAKQIRLASIDASFAEALHKVREAEAKTAGGKLDLGWRIKEVEANLMRDVLTAEQERQKQLEAYYKNVRDRAEAAVKAMAVLDQQIRDQISGSAAGDQSVKLDQAVDSISQELDKMESYVNELQRGSASILNREATVHWRPEVKP